MKQTKSVILISILLIGILAILPGSAACSSQSYSGTPESLTFANLRVTGATLIYIAQDQHFFSNNGLDFKIKEFDTGAATTDAIMKGQADMATMAEFLMVGNVFQKQPLSILGTMDKTNTQNLVGLTTRGFQKSPT